MRISSLPQPIFYLLGWLLTVNQSLINKAANSVRPITQATIARRWRPERSEGQAQAATLIRVMSCLHMPSIVPGQLPAGYCTEVVARLGRSKAETRVHNLDKIRYTLLFPVTSC
jgi:hypothetical protein